MLITDKKLAKNLHRWQFYDDILYACIMFFAKYDIKMHKAAFWSYILNGDNLLAILPTPPRTARISGLKS